MFLSLVASLEDVQQEYRLVMDTLKEVEPKDVTLQY